MSSRRELIPILVAFAATLVAGCGAEPASDAPAAESPVSQSDRQGDSDPRLDRALASYGGRDHAGGRSLAAAVLEEHPGSYRARFLLALGFHREKRYDVARTRFREIVASGVSFEGGEAVDHFLGWAHYHLGELEASRAAFRRHLGRDDGFADSHFGVGLVALELDDLDEARRRLERCVALLRAAPGKQSRLAKALARLADVHIRRREWEAAEGALIEALRISPKQRNARYKLGVVRRGKSRAGVSAPSSTTEDRGPSRLRFTALDAGATGLDVLMTSGRDPSTQILEVKGGGIALIDIDDDGHLDVFIPNGATLDDPEKGPGCRLYRNTGDEGVLRYEDVTERSGLALRRWSFGVTVGDHDGDGRDDIHVACYGPNVLFRNLGGGRFEDVSRRAGIADAGWGTGCAFGDVDGDGDLDLYVCNYLSFDPESPPKPAAFKSFPVLGGPIGSPPQHDVLFENLGDGRFRDGSRRLGVRDVAPAYALNVAMVDFDGDGRTEIFVANDSMASYLFRSDGERLREVGMQSGIALSGDGLAQATMGIAVADVDGNGRPDLFTTNFSGDTNTLHANLDGEIFEDRTRQLGLGRVSMPFLGWACGFADLDHDADEDLLVVNGHVFPQATMDTFDSSYRQTPLLFERRGARFERTIASTAGAWLDEPHADRTAAFGDLDGDGDIDVIVGGLNERPRILRNDGGSASGGFVRVRLLETSKSDGWRRLARQGLVELKVGERTQRRWIVPGGPFQSVSEPVAHFGVGEAKGPFEITVRWPGGMTSTVEARRDQTIDVERIRD